MFCLHALYVQILKINTKYFKLKWEVYVRGGGVKLTWAETTRHLLHICACKELLFRLYIFSLLSWYFPKDWRTEDIDLLRCTNECFNDRFSAMDFSNASSNARGSRWVRRCPHFVFWITFDTLLLCASELYVISGSNLLFSWTSLFPLSIKVAKLVHASLGLHESWFNTLKIFIL